MDPIDSLLVVVFFGPHRLNVTGYLNIVEYFHHLMTTVHPSTDGYSSRSTWLFQRKLSCSQMTYTVTRYQSTGAPLNCGKMGVSHYGCAAIV